jgi:hypothetical protein
MDWELVGLSAFIDYGAGKNIDAVVQPLLERVPVSFTTLESRLWPDLPRTSQPAEASTPGKAENQHPHELPFPSALPGRW